MELYQTVADWSLTSALTKYSVKEYWLRAALCSMAMGVSERPPGIFPLLLTFHVGPRYHPQAPHRICPKRPHIPLYARSQIRQGSYGRMRGSRFGEIYWYGVPI